MTKRPYIPQQDVSYMAGYSVAIKNSFLNLVPPRGTDWRFKSPPHPIHTRWASCPLNNIGLRTMRILSTLALLTLIAFGTKAQTIDLITMEHSCSFGLPIERLSIKLYRIGDKTVMEVKLTPGNGRQKKMRTKIDSVRQLTTSEFELVQKMFVDLKTTDLLKSFNGGGTDGTSTQLTFGDFQNRIAYTVWTLEHKTADRGLQGFRDICIHLTRLAGLEKLKLFD